MKINDKKFIGSGFQQHLRYRINVLNKLRAYKLNIIIFNQIM